MEGERRTKDIKGRLKEAAGAVSGDEEMRREGRRDQREGKLEQAREKVKDAARDASDAIRR